MICKLSTLPRVGFKTPRYNQDGKPVNGLRADLLSPFTGFFQRLAAGFEPEANASRLLALVRLWRGWAFLFLFATLLFPVSARAQEGGVTTLAFFSHPTERYNILIPAGWDNLSGDGARMVNNALGAQIDAFALRGDVEERLRAWSSEAIGAPTLDLIHTSTVQLTTGQWMQRLYWLPESGTGALTVFSQRIDDVEYVITLSVREPIYSVVVPLESALTDPAGASGVVDAGLAALGLEAERIGDVASEGRGATTWYRQALRVGDEDYTALVRRSGELTADIIVGPAGFASPEYAVILTVVRDFFLTPDTTSYLALGLAAAFLLLGGFIALLFVRRRNLRRDEAVLREVMR
jgi:hypothetical protein